MAQLKKKEIGGGEFVDLFKGLTELTKENYQIGLEFSISILEADLNLLNTQVEQWFAWHESYNRFMKDLAERFPNEIANFWNGNSKHLNEQTERFLIVQKDYIDSARKVSEKLTRDVISFTQKSMERNISIFNYYLNLFKD